MATKADRGAKRVCQNCRSKFYDLSRDPIICPICQTKFEIRVAPPPRSAFSAPKAAPVPVVDDEVLPEAAEGIEFVPLSEVEAGDDDDVSGLESDDLVEIEDETAEIDSGGDDDETFLADEDESEDDVSGFVGGGKPSEDEI
ncbi:MAG: TIGR02300 family protein [Hyphomicrobiales bacterium]|nr:TIGR02300 family protein [Hyphomicrobiales bacterium]